MKKLKKVHYTKSEPNTNAYFGPKLNVSMVAVTSKAQGVNNQQHMKTETAGSRRFLRQWGRGEEGSETE